MTMRIFLENLEKIRKFNKWNMEDMYERLDFGRSTFHNWKSGKSKPSLNMLEQIARNANITISDLLREGFIPGKTDKGHTQKFFERCQQIDERVRMIQTQLQMEVSDMLADITIMEKRT